MKRLVLPLVVLAVAAGPLAARAGVIISNLNGNDGSQSALLTALRDKGMGFTMPSGQDYRLDGVTLRLQLFGLNVSPIVQLWSNTGSNLPGAPLITLINPSFTTTGIANYDFTPPSPFTLQADTTYWLIAYGGVGDRYDWKASSPAVAPTGLATHFGSLFDGNGPPPTTSSAILNSYAITATAIPEPASVAVFGGLLAAGAWAVRRRTRTL